MSRREFIGAVLTAIFLAVCFVAALLEWRQCSERGGTTVRGLFWLECIDREAKR